MAPLRVSFGPIWAKKDERPESGFDFVPGARFGLESVDSVPLMRAFFGIVPLGRVFGTVRCRLASLRVSFGPMCTKTRQRPESGVASLNGGPFGHEMTENAPLMRALFLELRFLCPSFRFGPR